MNSKLCSIIFIVLTVLFYDPLVYAKENAAKATTPSKAVAHSLASDAMNDDQLLPPDDSVPICDPFECINRRIFTVNDKVDCYIAKPVATLYNKIMPVPLNLGIHNFFNNLATIPTLANDLLQLHIGQAVSDLGRLIINSTVGILGLFDVGERVGLPFYSNDFGLTLARWGWRNSTYIVFPFWGPSTIRDMVRRPVDYFCFSVYPAIHPLTARYTLYGLSVIDTRAQLLKMQCVLDEAALDQYVFFRSAYMQNRCFQIEENLALGFTQRKCPCDCKTS